MSEPKIVIVGGGVVGASVAWHLTERGCKNVVILEREPAPGLGSTGKATGGVRAQFETDINILLSLYSLDFFSNWGHDCGYEPRGYLFLATDEGQLEYLRTSAARQRALGYSGIGIVDRGEIARMIPGLNCDDVAGGSFGPRDGFIDPIAVMNGFLQGAVAGGAELRTGQRAVSIRCSSGRVAAVETDKDQIECDIAVLCPGAWAAGLAATAGIDLPVMPQRRQIIWARTAKPHAGALPMVIDLSDGFHFRQAKNSVDEVLLAFPDPTEPPSFSTDFDESFVEKVYAKARHRAPFLADAETIREKCRAGLYENSPDHHAILGKCGVEGLFLACGFSGHGVMHSPATGRAVAEIIMDGEAKFLDVSALSIDRFTTGDLLHETGFI